MSFGRVMELSFGDLRIRLAPLNRESMGEFIQCGGMQYHSVTRYLNDRTAPTLEDEQEWYDKTRADKESVVWGVWDVTQETPVLIGSTGLHGLGGKHFRQATSGVLLFRQDYWGKGIASHIHRARTWYAFQQLGLHRIKSAVIDGNKASYKALWNVGYETVSIERNTVFVDGKSRHQRNLECLNPGNPFWANWWGGDKPPAASRKARKRSQDALEWAQQHVKLL